MKDRYKSMAAIAWRRWVRPILIVVIAACAVRSTVADWNDVPSGSMNPSILEGDRIFVNKLAYDLKFPLTPFRIVRWSGPQRGDIVVFSSPADGKRLVKRVVAVPGDRLEMRNNVLLINGSAVKYAPERSHDGAGATEFVAMESLHSRVYPIKISPGLPSMRSFGPVAVPQDHYFVMGDNRDVSQDSRYFGLVQQDLIAGRAVSVLASINPESFCTPRWERFFKALP